MQEFEHTLVQAIGLHQKGDLMRAEPLYRAALRLQPGHVAANQNLAVLLIQTGRPVEAEPQIRHTLALDRSNPEAWNSLGVVLQQLSRHVEADQCYAQALSLRPDFAEAIGNRGIALRLRGQYPQAIELYRQALAHAPGALVYRNNLLFAMACADAGPAMLPEARIFGRLVSQACPSPYRQWTVPAATAPLRVGLVSADLRDHPVGYFLENLLQHSDPARIEFVAYDNARRSDEVTQRLKARCLAWRPIGTLDDQQASAQIHQDGIHILMDLAGHTAGNRLSLFGWRAAPLQIAWLGYFATTGVEQMDYVLADPAGVPPGSAGQFTERVLYMPQTRLCFTPPDLAVPVTGLPAQARGHLTFGCFQSLAKVGDAVLALWARVLAALPDARLRLQSPRLSDASLRQDLLTRLQALGVASHRVDLLPGSDRRQYLAAHADVDVILDTFPYPGGTTTCEALWMGVPTLTLAGQSWLSRQGASLLGAAGLDDWVAGSEDEYVAKAMAWGARLPELAALRARLRQQVLQSPLFDGARFARDFEAVLRQAWQAVPRAL